MLSGILSNALSRGNPLSEIHGLSANLKRFIVFIGRSGFMDWIAFASETLESAGSGVYT